MVHRSPVRKFAEVSGGVGHRHKLTKLVEESNNLISVFRCRDDCRNKWLCTVVSVLVCLWENITSYDKIRFRGKLPKTISLGKPQKNKMVSITDKSSHLSCSGLTNS